MFKLYIRHVQTYPDSTGKKRAQRMLTLLESTQQA